MEELQRHWSEEPPLGMVLRAHFGIRPREQVEPELPPGHGTPEHPIEITFEQYEQMKRTLQERPASGPVRLRSPDA